MRTGVALRLFMALWHVSSTAYNTQVKVLLALVRIQDILNSNVHTGFAVEWFCANSVLEEIGKNGISESVVDECLVH